MLSRRVPYYTSNILNTHRPSFLISGLWLELASSSCQQSIRKFPEHYPCPFNSAVLVVHRCVRMSRLRAKKSNARNVVSNYRSNKVPANPFRPNRPGQQANRSPNQLVVRSSPIGNPRQTHSRQVHSRRIRSRRIRSRRRTRVEVRFIRRIRLVSRRANRIGYGSRFRSVLSRSLEESSSQSP